MSFILEPGATYHLAGVAGAGMSALAQMVLASGCRVTGSDRFLDRGEHLETLERLRRAGVRLHPQDGSGLDAHTRALVVSTAIEADNPDMLRARALALPVVHRAEMIAAACRGGRVVAIAGTCGKTTVTGLTGWLLEQCGRDPFVVNGGEIVGWDSESATGSVRPASSGLWVIEADESDRSLLRFQPEWAVITNMSRDHFSMDDTVSLFRQFAGQVQRRIICPASVAARLEIPSTRARTVDDSALERVPEGWRFMLEGRWFASPLPGRHNAQNAQLACALCRELECEPDSLAHAFARFRGVRRRLEVKGNYHGASIVDDYAHNPEKIRAAWRTMSENHAPVLGVWRPHGFGPLSAMRGELIAMFRETLRPGDLLFVLPVFYAGGTASKTYDSTDFVADLQSAGVPARHADSYEALAEALPGLLQPGGALLVMGARDPGLSRFAGALCASEEA